MGLERGVSTTRCVNTFDKRDIDGVSGHPNKEI